MRQPRTKFLRAAVAIGAVGALFATAAIAAAAPATGSGCAQFEALKGAFPQARAIGFRGRTVVDRAGTPLFPGCATWSTSYRRGGRAAVEASLTLFDSPEQADSWRREDRGWTHLASGGFVRFDGFYDVESVYRDVIIVSRSIPNRPGWLGAQIRLQRQMRERVCAREQPANLRPSSCWGMF